MKFPKKYYSQAISLIEYGLENYPDEWFTSYTAHQFMGKIYFNMSDYENAYNSYLKALNFIYDKEDYIKSLAGDLFYTRLHLDNFQYSEDFQKYFDLFKGQDEFTLAFISNEFRIVIGELVLAKKNGADIKELKSKAKKMCSPFYVSKLQNVLNSHNHKDTLILTREVKLFLKSV